MNDRQAADESKRIGTRAYSGAFESVFSILIGAGLGLLADRQFDSSPWGLLVGLVIGFGAFILRMVRLRDEIAPPAKDAGSDETDEGKRS